MEKRHRDAGFGRGWGEGGVGSGGMGKPHQPSPSETTFVFPRNTFYSASPSFRNARGSPTGSKHRRQPPAPSGAAAAVGRTNCQPAPAAASGSLLLSPPPSRQITPATLQLLLASWRRTCLKQGLSLGFKPRSSSTGLAAIRANRARPVPLAAPVQEAAQEAVTKHQALLSSSLMDSSS